MDKSNNPTQREIIRETMSLMYKDTQSLVQWEKEQQLLREGLGEVLFMEQEQLLLGVMLCLLFSEKKKPWYQPLVKGLVHTWDIFLPPEGWAPLYVAASDLTPALALTP